MTVVTLPVTERTTTGKKAMAALRADYQIPAVLYGAGGDSRNLCVYEHDLADQLRAHNKVFMLTLEGKEQPVYMQDVQIDPINDRPLHVDFLRIDLSKPLTLPVLVNLIGHPKGASKGGRLVKDVLTIDLACLPSNIPDHLEVNVRDVDTGDSITADQLKLPEGCTLAVPGDTVVVHMPPE